MKRVRTVVASIGAVVLGLSTAGTAAAQYDAFGPYYASPPIAQPMPPRPAPRPENPGPAPGPNSVFIRGRWDWTQGRGYLWTPGHWAVRYDAPNPPPGSLVPAGPPPTPNSGFVPGYWSLENGHYIWVGGHWNTYRQGSVYIHPHQNFIDGQWQLIQGYWTTR